MAQKEIQIADKPTLDELKALLENSGYGLEALKDAITENIDATKIAETFSFQGPGTNGQKLVLNVSGKGYLKNLYCALNENNNIINRLRIVVDDVDLVDIQIYNSNTSYYQNLHFFLYNDSTKTSDGKAKIAGEFISIPTTISEYFMYYNEIQNNIIFNSNGNITSHVNRYFVIKYLEENLGLKFEKSLKIYNQSGSISSDAINIKGDYVLLV